MLENEINFELNKLEKKLSSLLKNYDELKNKMDKLKLEKKDIEVQLSLSNYQLTNKNNLDFDNGEYLEKKNQIKEEINKNILEIDKCINFLNLS